MSEMESFTSEDEPRIPYLTSQFEGLDGPFIAATDYMKLYSDQLRPFIPGDYVVLGTDGFGRSDTRAEAKTFFEVNRYFIVIAALSSLVSQGKLKSNKVTEALEKVQYFSG